MKKRALTDEQKHNILIGIEKCWTNNKLKDLRLGQLIVCATEIAGVDLFNIEDEDLLDCIMGFLIEKFGITGGIIEK